MTLPVVHEPAAIRLADKSTGVSCRGYIETAMRILSSIWDSKDQAAADGDAAELAAAAPGLA